MPNHQQKPKRKKKRKVIDVSKLAPPNEVTVEIEVDGRTYMSTLEVPEGSSFEEIALAKENLAELIRQQHIKAYGKTRLWRRAYRWLADRLKKSDATKRAERIMNETDGE